MLERLLAVTHDILQGQDLNPGLDSISRAIVELFGFKYVTIVAADSPGREMYRRIALGWPEQIREERIGEHISRADIQKSVLLPQFEVLPHCFYIPVEHEVYWSRSIYTGDLPFDAPRAAPDAWHERDTLTLVLPDRDGQMMGYLSVDGPLNGKVPTLDMLRQMQLFVNLVGLALANSRSHRVEVEQRQVLEQTQHLQNDFFGMVSHEVRSPLAAIRGATALLETHFETLGEERRRELLGVLTSSTTRLSSIFEDFLLLSRMDAGHLALRIEPVATVAVIEESMARIRSQHPDRTINAAYLDPVPSVLADEGRMVQVLTNLLSNAVKYSFADTPIHIDIKVFDDCVSLGVVNEGPGIATSDRDKLFTRFGRLTQDDGSTGLGLYICRELVGMMDGSIGFESEPGKLTSFWFVLPRAG